MLEYILLIVGIGLLIKGADLLVDGASSLAHKLNVSTLIIGLTVVSFGTSMPELFVSILSAMEGKTKYSLVDGKLEADKEGDIFGVSKVIEIFPSIKWRGDSQHRDSLIRMMKNNILLIILLSK